MRFARCLPALSAILAAPAAATQPALSTTPAEAQDERPVLWSGLRAGMSPREALAILQRQGIRARLAVDPDDRREYVETPRPIIWAGRPYLMAMGFVENRLFHVTINSQKRFSGRIPFERSHFREVAGLLTRDYGPPVEISAQPVVSDVANAGANTTASGRFEQSGVRADLTGTDTYASFMRDVYESVTIRFWRVVDAERFATGQPQKPPAQP